MGKKLYVGNLSYSTTDAKLQALFAQAGQVVEAVVVMDRETGRSKGFGFVEMGSDAAANTAVDRFNGTDVDGRTIKVAEAQPRPPRQAGGGDRDRAGGGRSSRW